MADAKRLGEFEQGHDGRVALTAFEARQILLRKARALLDLFLGELLVAPQPRETARMPSLVMPICRSSSGNHDYLAAAPLQGRRLGPLTPAFGSERR